MRIQAVPVRAASLTNRVTFLQAKHWVVSDLGKVVLATPLRGTTGAKKGGVSAVGPLTSLEAQRIDIQGIGNRTFVFELDLRHTGSALQRPNQILPTPLPPFVEVSPVENQKGENVKTFRGSSASIRTIYYVGKLYCIDGVHTGENVFISEYQRSTFIVFSHDLVLRKSKKYIFYFDTRGLPGKI